MSTEVVKLDPSAISVNRSEFNITPYIKFQGVDWGDAAIQAYLADQEVGSNPIDFRIPNRTVQIPLNLKSLGAPYGTVRGNFQQKAGLFQREGGIIGRVVNGTPYYADIVDAVLHLSGSTYAAFRDFDTDAVLTLTTLPDWYGDEIVLDNGTATGVFVSKLQLSGSDAVVAGHMPGRLRLITQNNVTGTGTDQKGMIWGLRSRYYDPAASAALFYEAEALTALNGAASISLAGASGGSYVGVTPLNSTLNSWVGMISTTIASGGQPLTHKGTYRVWARVQASGVASNPNPTTTAPGAAVQVRFAWGGGSLSVPVLNDSVQVPAVTSNGTVAWYLVDLGQIRLDPALLGTNQWFGVVQFNMNGGSGGGSAPFQVGVDCLYFQPLDESAGRLQYVPQSTSSALVLETESAGATGANDSANGGTIVWSNPGNAAGVTDGVYAVATFTGAGQKTQYLKVTNRSFSIPSGAVITGIKVWVYYSVSGGVSWFFNLAKAGVVQGGSYDPANFVSGPGAVLQLGGPNDLWQGSWTPADINNSGFGASAYMISSGSGSISIDNLYMGVYYTLGTGFFVATDAVCYGGGTVEARYNGAYRNAGTGSSVYGRVSRIIGDLPRIPPSGLESRPVEVFVKMSRGDLGSLQDSSLDSLSVQAKYRPSFLYVA